MTSELAEAKVDKGEGDLRCKRLLTVCRACTRTLYITDCSLRALPSHRRTRNLSRGVHA